ncbi:MAG: DUF3316 domain-containing protein [Prevotella sp.]|nr:DUF3316 domain-containing protein [Prevotella sp.]
MKSRYFSIMGDAMLLFIAMIANAQEPMMTHQPRQRFTLIGIGQAKMLDTYLSNENYSGTELRMVSQTEKWHYREALKESERKDTVDHFWSHAFRHQLSLQYTHPRSNDCNYLGGLYACIFNYSHNWNRWIAGHHMTFQAGLQAELGLGFLYSTRNTNNPAQARAYLNAGPAVSVNYPFHAFRMRRPLALRYEVNAPLLGILFSPNYGQSYYEIFTRGNYDHNCVLTTPFNAPTLRQMLTLDVQLKPFTMRLGYIGDYEQAKVNSLKYHTYSHLFTIGFVKNL